MLTWMTATPADIEVITGVLDKEKIRIIHQNTSMDFFLKYSGMKDKDFQKLIEVAIPYMIETQTKYSELLGLPMSDSEVEEWKSSKTFQEHLTFLVSNAMAHDLEWWQSFYEFKQEREKNRKEQLGF